MDEIEFFYCITGEWMCDLKERTVSFKYDGFHMYKSENAEWVQTYEWSLVKLSESSPVITGILFRFLQLPELLLQHVDEKNGSLHFRDMQIPQEIYHFEKL